MAFAMLFASPMTSTDRPPTYEGGQDIRDRSFDYACRVVGVCEALDAGGRIGRLMVPQILSCSLSFASMLEEARAAESDVDFISKCGIGLKECRESWMRLRVCHRRKIGPSEAVADLVREGNELISIVTAIIRNKRRNVAAKRASEKAAQATAKEARRRARSADTHSKFQIPNS
jgi:four helix bundle protein